MKKDPKIFLRHILESTQEIGKYLEGISKREFLKSTQIQDKEIPFRPLEENRRIKGRADT